MLGDKIEDKDVKELGKNYKKTPIHQISRFGMSGQWINVIDRNQKKPVMVWVHGGADTGGWSYEPD